MSLKIWFLKLLIKFLTGTSFLLTKKMKEKHERTKILKNSQVLIKQYTYLSLQ